MDQKQVNQSQIFTKTVKQHTLGFLYFIFTQYYRQYFCQNQLRKIFCDSDLCVQRIDLYDNKRGTTEWNEWNQIVIQTTRDACVEY